MNGNREKHNKNHKLLLISRFCDIILYITIMVIITWFIFVFVQTYVKRDINDNDEFLNKLPDESIIFSDSIIYHEVTIEEEFITNSVVDTSIVNTTSIIDTAAIDTTITISRYDHPIELGIYEGRYAKISTNYTWENGDKIPEWVCYYYFKISYVDLINATVLLDENSINSKILIDAIVDVKDKSQLSEYEIYPNNLSSIPVNYNSSSNSISNESSLDSIDIDTLLRLIAVHETGENPTLSHYNKNGTTDHGMYQLNDVFLKAYNIQKWQAYDKYESTRVLKKIFENEYYPKYNGNIKLIISSYSYGPTWLANHPEGSSVLYNEYSWILKDLQNDELYKHQQYYH